jgi:hypothetical protein
MYYDLRKWMAAYEGFETICIPKAVWGSSIPENKDKEFDRIMAIYATGLVDSVWLFDQLEQFGYTFDDGTAQLAINEAQARAAATDPFASRMDDEVQEEGGQ